jgi:ATP-dependent Zn protease
MNNYFFPEKKIKFLNFFFKKNQKFVFKKNIEIIEDLNNQTLIKDDIYGQQDHSELCIKSFKIANKVKLSNYNSKNILLERVLKQKLIRNIEEILRVTYLLEKIKSQYNLQNLYLCKLFQDLKLFNYLKKNNYISKKINISKTYFFLNKLFYFFVNIYFFFEFVFFTRKNFSSLSKKLKKKKLFRND